MSSNITSPSNKSNTASSGESNVNASPSGKGKGKAVEESTEEEDEDEEDEEDDEEMQSGDEEDEDEEEEEFEEIDPSAILPTGRRTRGVKVDYTSKEALARAGLQGNEDGEDSDEDVEMK
ncbi:hypothetical protein CVT25_000189 [Psilocybe cyanescens]|uniref:Histone chaperone domain-containing protein n=1 Tax=Psilocybe cyanescens TaxID=93625 RepID=A0A409XQI4_PSICY|nr:hypothetical protein CVT25_000189 [Psilocybe cyanescens]